VPVTNLDTIAGVGQLKAGFVSKAANYTVVAADTGKVIEAAAVDLVFTLPATVAGLQFTFVVKTISATTGLSISPAAADKIMGNGFTAADDKDAINTAATDRVGDSLTLVGDGVDGWYVVGVTGTWARET
jgi:hypothetical protein